VLSRAQINQAATDEDKGGKAVESAQLAQGISQDDRRDGGIGGQGIAAAPAKHSKAERFNQLCHFIKAFGFAGYDDQTQPAETREQFSILFQYDFFFTRSGGAANPDWIGRRAQADGLSEFFIALHAIGDQR
jgi:hypothetical protein